MRVGALHRVEPAEGGHQHEQRRARQVEVGHQQIDGLEAIARRDEDVGLAGEWPDRAVLGRRCFQQAETTSCRRATILPSGGASRVERGRRLR